MHTSAAVKLKVKLHTNIWADIIAQTLSYDLVMKFILRGKYVDEQMLITDGFMNSLNLQWE